MGEMIAEVERLLRDYDNDRLSAKCRYTGPPEHTRLFNAASREPGHMLFVSDSQVERLRAALDKVRAAWTEEMCAKYDDRG